MVLLSRKCKAVFLPGTHMVLDNSLITDEPTDTGDTLNVSHQVCVCMCHVMCVTSYVSCHVCVMSCVCLYLPCHVCIMSGVCHIMCVSVCVTSCVSHVICVCIHGYLGI